MVLRLDERCRVAIIGGGVRLRLFSVLTSVWTRAAALTGEIAFAPVATVSVATALLGSLSLRGSSFTMLMSRDDLASSSRRSMRWTFITRAM